MSAPPAGAAPWPVELRYVRAARVLTDLLGQQVDASQVDGVADDRGDDVAHRHVHAGIQEGGDIHQGDPRPGFRAEAEDEVVAEGFARAEQTFVHEAGGILHLGQQQAQVDAGTFVQFVEVHGASGDGCHPDPGVAGPSTVER